MFEPGGTNFVFSGRMGERIRANNAHWLTVAPARSPGMLDLFHKRKAGQARTGLLAWAGEYVGKYLIGAIHSLRLSNDANLRNVIAQVVRDLIASQGDDGYLGPFGPAERMVGQHDKWDLWGHYHCMLGLLLWHQEQGDSDALRACRRAADLFCTTFIGTGMRVADAGSPTQNEAIAHIFVLLHRATGEPRYLQMARDIESDWARPDGGNYVNGFQRGEAFFQGRLPRWESLHAAQALVEFHAI